MNRLFLDGHGALVAIKFHDTVLLRVSYAICKNGGASLPAGGLLHKSGQVVPIKQVVAEDQATVVPFDERSANNKCFRESVGLGLYGVFETHSPLRSVTQQLAECLSVAWSRD